LVRQGGGGKAFVEQALAKGHRVTAFLRDRSKFAVDDLSLTIIDGHLFHEASVKSALTPDLEAVVEGMTASGVSRLVSVSSMGASDSPGTGPFWVRFVAKVILKRTITDKTLQESVLKTSGLEWTVLRPPMLVRKPATSERLVWEGQKPPNKVA